jgi:formiminotetrahydrofolate cyclodeaminase
MGLLSGKNKDKKGVGTVPQGYVNEAAEKKSFTALPVDEFTYRLSSKEPIPGGGGAAALAGALGAALGGMVASLTIGKPKYAEVEDEIQSLKVAVYRIQKELLELVEKDALVFAPLAGAYRMAAGTEEEKKEKERVMQACLKEASIVPLEIMEKCNEAIPLIEKLSEKGSVLAVSDAGCAAVILKSALLSAWLNVRINIRLISDEKFSHDTDSRGQELLAKGLPLADKIYNSVAAKLG